MNFKSVFVYSSSKEVATSLLNKINVNTKHGDEWLHRIIELILAMRPKMELKIFNRILKQKQPNLPVLVNTLREKMISERSFNFIRSWGIKGTFPSKDKM
jgi:hypothetical protein